MIPVEDRVTDFRNPISQLNDPTPTFEILVGWSKNYNGIFSSKFDRVEDARSILVHVVECGRVLVTGRGGGAKTVVLTRIAKLALEKNIFTAFVTLKGWTANDYPRWNGLQGFSNRIAYLLEHFGIGLTSSRSSGP